MQRLEEFLNVEEVDSLVGVYLGSVEWEFIVQANNILEEFRNFQLKGSSLPSKTRNTTFAFSRFA